MKIGVYGGSFNPPHLGHMTAAAQAVEKLGLQKLLLIPAGIPPHKELSADTPSPAHRLEMTRLAAEAVAWETKVETEVSDMEMRREGKSYTSDTLRALHDEYPDDELVLLMGTDMLESFSTWHEPEEITRLASLCAFGRNEKDTEETLSSRRDKLLKVYPGSRIETMQLPDVVEVSSTELRAALPEGKGQEYLAPQIYGYILREHLYGTKKDCRRLTIDELRPVALSYLKAKRIPHVLGVEQTAIRLAEKYGADVKKAQFAALLHDCTKRLDMAEQTALCEKYHIPLDDLEKKALKLLHAKTGAALARDVFGADDEIYNAILWHTTGRPDMTLLEKVIYLADYTDPTRDFPGVEELRGVVDRNLDEGVLKGLEMTVEEMAERGQPVHPDTLEARDYLLEKGIGRKG